MRSIPTFPHRSKPVRATNHRVKRAFALREKRKTIFPFAGLDR